MKRPRSPCGPVGVIVAMRFAILGDHPDGWAVAAALAESGRHQIDAYCGPTARIGSARCAVCAVTSDLEEVLADPAVEAVIVAGRRGRTARSVAAGAAIGAVGVLRPPGRSQAGRGLRDQHAAGRHAPGGRADLAAGRDSAFAEFARQRPMRHGAADRDWNTAHRGDPLFEK